MAPWLAEVLVWLSVAGAMLYAGRRIWRQVTRLRTATSGQGVADAGCATCDGCGGCPATRPNRADSGERR